jgi:hypothetical protein
LLVIASVWSFYERIGSFQPELEPSNYFRNHCQRFVLGFSAAMLGISGFESSANFVEEQEQGVFPKHYVICGQLLVFQPCNNSFIAYLYHSFGTSR